MSTAIYDDVENEEEVHQEKATGCASFIDRAKQYIAEYRYDKAFCLLAKCSETARDAISKIAVKW